jgi:hypothetical protein
LSVGEREKNNLFLNPFIRHLRDGGEEREFNFINTALIGDRVD